MLHSSSPLPPDSPVLRPLWSYLRPPPTSCDGSPVARSGQTRECSRTFPGVEREHTALPAGRKLWTCWTFSHERRLNLHSFIIYLEDHVVGTVHIDLNGVQKYYKNAKCGTSAKFHQSLSLAKVDENNNTLLYYCTRTGDRHTQERPTLRCSQVCFFDA